MIHVIYKVIMQFLINEEKKHYRINGAETWVSPKEFG